uniref:Uncharacterized protein n=1 Tax=Arundo donax TaxID=35708 RepID=A0A0A9F1X3_ARUDO
MHLRKSEQWDNISLNWEDSLANTTASQAC